MRFHLLLPRFARGLAIGFAITSAAHAQSAQPGRYEFTAVASGNRAFSGVLHVTSMNGVFSGRLVSTLSNPMPLRAATRTGTTVEFVADPGGGRTIMIRLEPQGDSLIGTFSDGQSSGPVRAVYATK